MMQTLVWFRQDLRLKDNPALSYACDQGSILPVFILDTTVPEPYQLGGASAWWLHHSLKSLDKSLAGKLRCYQGDPLKIIPQILTDNKLNTLVWNRCYEPWRVHNDSQLKAQLSQKDIEVRSFNGSLLWQPTQIHKADGSPYRVFTPYYKNGCLKGPEPRYPEAQPDTIHCLDRDEPDNNVESLKLLPEIDWYSNFESLWQPGETGAGDRLSDFLRERLTDYTEQRDCPAIEGTSRLSPHLHFGELSPNQIWYATKERFADRMSDEGYQFLAEIGWREFSYYLLFHWPDLPENNFNAKFDRFPWRKSSAHLEAWQRGQTGIPIVDAGMRELWQTGYMHNRVRMLVGSFLVKNLLVHWQEGARWFHDTLVDADLASNSASWQWVAGSGADAAPYFRIFNPVLQGEKFDKEGRYVKKYCPELAQLPNKYIHKPWEAPDNILSAAGIKLGEDYPEPMVDLKVSRQGALDAFSQLKR